MLQHAHLLTISLHFKVVFPYPKEIVLVPNNRNLFLVNRHLATATEHDLLASLSKTTASQYYLSRAQSNHLAIRSSCVRGCHVVAEGGQNWCGTRTFEKFNKKTKIQVHLLCSAERKEENRNTSNNQKKEVAEGDGGGRAK